MKKYNCRYCGAELKTCMCDLGFAPLSNDYIEEADLEKFQPTLPLSVYHCDSCGLIQIINYELPGGVFNEHYKYYSSFTESWLEHCKKYVDGIVQELNLNKNSKVMEIASNDGYLLQYFIDYGISPLGIEPSSSTAEMARKKGIETISEFFDDEFAARLINERGKYKLIIGNNVLAHVPNIKRFVRGLKIALDDNGTITMEFPHVLNLIKWNEFDTIYHEHYSYLNTKAVKTIFEEQGLKLYNIEKLPTHGGSLRIYATHKENDQISVSDSIDELIREEEEFGMNDSKCYLDFYKNTQNMKLKIWKKLVEIKESGKNIVGYGAAAKGNTLFNYCGIKNDIIDYVTDISPYKQGLYLPGSKIPIYSPDVIKETKPDYVLIIPWNIKEEIMQQLSYIKEWGGKFLILIPEIVEL